MSQRNGQASRQQHSPTLTQLNGNADQPMSEPSTVRNPTQPTQSSDGVFGQDQADALVSQEFLKKVSFCSTIGELVRLLPVPVQPVSKGVLDGVYQACQKLGAAEVLLKFWKDVLRSDDVSELANVAQLNSIRAPTVQTCKEALLVENDGGLSKMKFDATVKAMKLSALTRMIEIKEKEVENLRLFAQAVQVGRRLRAAWDSTVAENKPFITPEHFAVLNDGELLKRVAQVTVSIGEASYKRVKLAKKERVVMRKDGDTDMTDVHSKDGKKKLMSLIDESLKRKEQSQRDRTRSGKGKRSTGVSKKNKTPKKPTMRKKNKGPVNGGKPKKSGPGAKRRERR